MLIPAPWGVLGQGKFKSEEELKKRATLRGNAQPTEADLKTCKVLQEVATELGGDVHLAHSKLINLIEDASPS